MTQAKRVLIVGGVAGGASAAARARRLSEEAEIILFERGRHVSFANCGLPYHIGGAIKERERLLVQTADGLRKRFRIDVRTRSEVVRIDRELQRIHVRNLETGLETEEAYDALVLSPGAEPIRPPIPGIESRRVMTLRNLEDMDAIKHLVDEEKPANSVIVGGGYIGLEMAEALRERGIGVTLVELAPQVFGVADGEMVSAVHQQLKMHGVDLRLQTSVTQFQEIQNNSGQRLSVHLSSGDVIECGLAIMAIGVKPEASLAREAGLEIGQTGGIVVDQHMRTSDQSIYAVGDAVEVGQFIGGARALIPLAGPANRQGRIAADNIFGRKSVYKRTQGTAICKIFDIAIGMTGLSEKGLQRAGMEYEKIYVHPSSHAGYYPGASQMSLKLLFSPADGTILGAQAVGADGVDKRIDVLAVAMRAKMTVRDLKDLELSYAPPYGSAKDPINYAGFVASNILDGDAKVCHAADMLNPREDQLLLDVRTKAEVEAGTIPGSVHIPVDDLRSRLDNLPKNKELLVFCQVGLRGYLACRILSQNGFNCRNLSGGWKTYAAWMSVMGKTPKAPKDPQGPGSKEMKDDTGEKSCCSGAATQASVEGKNAIPASGSTTAMKEIDARALQCPGPIMRLKAELEKMKIGEGVRITVSDTGFPEDVKAWCRNTGNILAMMESKRDAEGAYFEAVVMKGNGNGETTVSAIGSELPVPSESSRKKKSIVVFSGDFDKAMAAFIIANGAASMGSEVTLFFTFWGLNILRRGESVSVGKTIVERMFGWMMPRGAGRIGLSRMNIFGMGLRMIKCVMLKKNVASLPELIDSARKAGVRLVACSMSMNLMGLKREELIDGVEEGGVASYLDTAEMGTVNLFI